MTQAVLEPARVGDDYLDLVRALPLRRLRDEADLNAAHEVLGRLMRRGEQSLSPGEIDYLGALALLVSDYEDRHYSPALDPPTPQQRLEHVLEESGITADDLARILDAPRASAEALLTGGRPLTADDVRRLADYYRLDPRYFL